MARNGIPVVDGDGHVMEDWDGLLQYMPEPYIKSGRFKGRIFPPLDHLHSASLFQLMPGAFARFAKMAGWSLWRTSASSARCFTAPVVWPSAKSLLWSSPSTWRAPGTTGLPTPI